MDADQIQAWAREAGEYATKQFTFDWHKTRDAHFARLVAAAAFEEAAKACESRYADLNADKDCAKRWPEQVKINSDWAQFVRARAILDAKP